MVACRQLGFDAGEFRSLGKGVSPSPELLYIFDDVTLSPSWLADLPCEGTEATLLDCGSLAFGDTASCGFSQRLVCSNGAQGTYAAADHYSCTCSVATCMHVS